MPEATTSRSLHRWCCTCLQRDFRPEFWTSWSFQSNGAQLQPQPVWQQSGTILNKERLLCKTAKQRVFQRDIGKHYDKGYSITPSLPSCNRSRNKMFISSTSRSSIVKQIDLQQNTRCGFHIATEAEKFTGPQCASDTAAWGQNCSNTHQTTQPLEKDQNTKIFICWVPLKKKKRVAAENV